MNITLFLANNYNYTKDDELIGVFNTENEANSHPPLPRNGIRQVEKIQLEIDNNGNLVKPVIL